MAKRLTYPRRGEVWLVNFDPTIGAEIKKTRPAIILQNDIGNRYSSLTIVAAISSGRGRAVYPTTVPIQAPEGGLVHNSLALLDQLRSADKRRLVKKLGRLKPETMRRIETALLISLGIAEV